MSFGESSINYPLKFFMDFFPQRGFYKFYKEFFIESHNHNDTYWHDYYHEENSLKEEYMIYCSDRLIESGPDAKKIYFKDELKEVLGNQIVQSKQLIREKITSFDYDDGKIRTFLKTMVNDLCYLINAVKGSPNFMRYPIILELLYNFTLSLFHRFNSFLSPTEFPIHKEAEEFLQSISTGSTLLKEVKTFPIGTGIKQGNKPEKEITGFKWIANPVENTFRLYEFLTNNSIISKFGTAEKFETAFKGEKIGTALMIEWLFKAKGGHIKPAILRVIYLLMFELKLLEEIPVQLQLAKTIEAIFCDPDGNPIEHTDVSISQGKNTKGVKEDEELDKLIDKLREVPFSVTIAENH